MKQRWLSLLLVISLLLGFAAPVYATGAEPAAEAAEQIVEAQETPEETAQEASEAVEADAGRDTLVKTAHGVNPLYAESPEQETSEPQSAMAPMLDAAAPTLDATYTFLSLNAAAAELRDYMVARKDTFTIYVTIPGGYVKDWITDVFIPLACSEELAVSPTAGDYLKWSWFSYDMSLVPTDATYIYCRITLTMKYYTTAAQEETAKTMLRQAYNSLGLSGLTDYGKYAAIYNYVTDHVAYDYAGLASRISMESRMESLYGSGYLSYVGRSWSTYRSYYEIHTAYAALYYGKAVCQGFATLYYALCKMAGLPVRMVAGTSNNQNHGWNIIKLDGYWYGVDATWDDSCTSGQWNRWQYFAKGSSTFNSGTHAHVNFDEYSTVEFKAKYPMAYSDYTKPKVFWDIPNSAWYINDVNSAYNQGFMNGTSSIPPKFEPEGTTTRAMIVTILYRMAGEPAVRSTNSYSDVPQGEYYTKAVAWAKENGVVNGVGGNRFDPNGVVTRQDAMVMIYNYRTKYLRKTASGSTSVYSFSDGNQVASYSRAAIQWAIYNGIITGTTTSTEVLLDPEGNATRAQIAAIFVRYVGKYGKT